MTKLSFLLLGPLEIEQDGVPLSGLTAIKARALLVYLADRFRPCTRQALSGLLWSDVTEELARTSLRTALAQLRKAVGEYVLADRHRLWFNPGLPHWIDAHIFAHACNSRAGGEIEPHPAVRRSLREAIYLYRGEFLSDLPRPTPAFEEWVQNPAILSASGARCAARARPGCTSALCPGRRHRRHARRMLALDPLREDAHRTLMELHAARATRSRRCASMTNARASWRQN